MRDKNRIPIICKKLEEYWKLFPDLRLGQLLLNAAVSEKVLYNIEDEKLIFLIKHFTENVQYFGEKNEKK